jgi:hypothetical protein
MRKHDRFHDLGHTCMPTLVSNPVGFTCSKKAPAMRRPRRPRDTLKAIAGNCRGDVRAT